MPDMDQESAEKRAKLEFFAARTVFPGTIICYAR